MFSQGPICKGRPYNCRKSPLAIKPLTRTLRRRAQAEIYARSQASVPTRNQVSWDSFAHSVSGEWEGVTVTFSPVDGSPQSLPEYYVPDAYRDWGVQLFDWQSQCSCSAKDGSLIVTSRRMMPTVGCEADAVAFTEDRQAIFWGAASEASLTEDGGYNCGPAADAFTNRNEICSAAMEACIPLFRDPKERVRIIHILKRFNGHSPWSVSAIEVHKERWDGPYSGKRELSGCGGGMNGFSQHTKLSVQEKLFGMKWAGSENMAPLSGLFETHAVIGLPLNCWSATRIENGNLSVAAGVVLEDGIRMKVSIRELNSDGQLVTASMAEYAGCG
jgi:hypothetical protein